MRARRFTVTTTAQQIVEGEQGSASVPQSAIIKVPSGGATIEVGGHDLASGSGFELAAGEHIEVDLVTDDVWAVISGGSQEVQIIEKYPT